MSKNQPQEISPRPKKKNPSLWLVTVICWILLVFYLSDQPGLSTLPILFKLKIIPIISNETLAAEIDYVIRKLAHIAAYAVLYLLTFSAVQRLQKKPRNYYSLIRATLFSLLFCFIFAVSDEIHQYYVVDRTARIFDVIIDMFGVIIGQVFLLIILILRKLLCK